MSTPQPPHTMIPRYPHQLGKHIHTSPSLLKDLLTYGIKALIAIGLGCLLTFLYEGLKRRHTRKKLEIKIKELQRNKEILLAEQKSYFKFLLREISAHFSELNQNTYQYSLSLQSHLIFLLRIFKMYSEIKSLPLYRLSHLQTLLTKLQKKVSTPTTSTPYTESPIQLQSVNDPQPPPAIQTEIPNSIPQEFSPSLPPYTPYNSTSTSSPTTYIPSTSTPTSPIPSLDSFPNTNEQYSLPNMEPYHNNPMNALSPQYNPPMPLSYNNPNLYNQFPPNSSPFLPGGYNGGPGMNIGSSFPNSLNNNFNNFNNHPNNFNNFNNPHNVNTPNMYPTSSYQNSESFINRYPALRNRQFS